MTGVYIVLVSGNIVAPMKNDHIYFCLFYFEEECLQIMFLSVYLQVLGSYFSFLQISASVVLFSMAMGTTACIYIFDNQNTVIVFILLNRYSRTHANTHSLDAKTINFQSSLACLKALFIRICSLLVIICQKYWNHKKGIR